MLRLHTACRLAWPDLLGLERLLGLLATSQVEQRWLSQVCLVLEDHHLPWHPVGFSIGLPWPGRARTVVWRMPMDLV